MNELRFSNWIQFKIFFSIHCNGNKCVSTCGFLSAAVIFYWINIKLFQVYTFYRHEISNCSHFCSQLEVTTWKCVKIVHLQNFELFNSPTESTYEVELCDAWYIHFCTRIVGFCQLFDKWTLLIRPSCSLKKPTEMKQRLITDNLQMKTFIIYGTSILNDDQSTLWPT